MNKKPTTYLGKLKQDPAFQKGYQEALERLDVAIMIAKARQQRKMSQKELAKKIGSNQSVISRIEHGSENLSLGKLKKIAAALGFKMEVNFV